MGLLALKLLMSMQRDRRHIPKQIQARNRSIASVAKRNRSSCQHGNSQHCKRMGYSVPDLPEDLWRHIHSLLPLRDAARVACVSHAFLRSWRCHPNLTFSKKDMGQNDGTSMELALKVDRILKKHSCTDVNEFKLEFYDHVDGCYLNSWLHIAAELRTIEKLTLILPCRYDFPCSLLVNGFRNSVQHLHISGCAFRPMAGLGHLRTLYLCMVRITGDELGCLLSNSSALEQLRLNDCSEITYLKIPGLLQHLRYIMVSECRKLQMIESKAPNLSTFHYTGAQIQVSFGDPFQVKDMALSCFIQCNTIYNARAKLPSLVPNLETLSICSVSEVTDTPIVLNKFLHLKYLSISLEVGDGAFSPIYDYFSLVSFLDACPLLKTFELVGSDFFILKHILPWMVQSRYFGFYTVRDINVDCMQVSQTRMKHDSVLGDPSHLRQMPERRYDNIKNVKIIGFCSAKSMIELACHILENATSLECLTLDTIYDSDDDIARHVHEVGECNPIGRHMIREARKALLAIESYIMPKVPSMVKINVLEPCRRCHAFAA